MRTVSSAPPSGILVAAPQAPKIELDARRRLLRYLVLAGVSGLGPVSVDLYLPALPTMSAALSTREAVLQLTITAFLIGLVAGHLLAGPISDTFGRRRPLLLGLLGYTAASLLCAVAPSAGALIAIRFVQGFAGATGLVIGLACVRDLYSGRAAARFMSRLQLVTGLGPILAPFLGGQLLALTSWRGLFVAQATVGAILVFGVAVGLGETLPLELRRPAHARDAVQSLGQVASNLRFLAYAIPAGFVTGVAFSYISSSSFVFENVYGLSPQAFSLVFGANALFLVGAAQVNAALLRTMSPERLLRVGLSLILLGPCVVVLVVTTTKLGLIAVIPALMLALTGFGFTNANAAALALTLYPDKAGSAAALVGTLRLSTGALAAPLGGLVGGGGVLTMALEMAGMASLAGTVYVVLQRVAHRVGSPTAEVCHG